MLNLKELKLRCSEHRNCSYQYLALAKQHNFERRLLCGKCVFSQETLDWKQDLKNLIPLSIVLDQPEILMNKLTEGELTYCLKNIENIEQKDYEQLIQDQILQFELLDKILQQIKDQLSEQLQEFQKRKQFLLKLKEELQEKSQYNLFKQLIFQLEKFDQQSQSEQYNQIEIQMSEVIENMVQRNFFEITKQIRLEMDNHRKMSANLWKPKSDMQFYQIAQVFKQYDCFISNLNKDFSIELQIPEFKVLQTSFFQAIQQKIEQTEKKIKRIDLIYLGSKEGLSSQAFWRNVNGKGNLLMVFKNNNSIFGGYSPCQWKSHLKQFVQDQSASSFLFSQSRKEIYPLRQDKFQCAIYCDSQYGPTFGGGHDMNIMADFTIGSSNLGHSYSYHPPFYDSKPISIFGENRDGPFGSPQANIQECEIYELILE